MVWVSVYFTTDLIQTGVDLRRTIFRMKVAFGIFVKFFDAFFKTSKRGVIYNSLISKWFSHLIRGKSLRTKENVKLLKNVKGLQKP